MDGKAPDRVRERRRYPRCEVSLEGTLCAAGVKAPCRVRNISAGGALVESEARLGLGEPVTLEVHDLGSMTGRVARVTSTAVAIAFEAVGDVDDVYVGEWSPYEPRVTAAAHKWARGAAGGIVGRR